MILSIMLAAAAAFAAPVETPLTAPGPLAPLAGTLTDAGKGKPVVLILPGSGPTDRDGNNPLGVTSASYRLLAHALAERGVSTVRIDKRGLFGSKAAVADGNAVTIADYAGDTNAWVSAIRARTGVPCVWLLGHSEGGLIALAAAERSEGICGAALVAAPGRKVGVALREQLRANPANAPILDAALAAIESLEAGKHVDSSGLHPALQALFAPPVQGFLIDLLAQDPAALAGKLKVPLLIVHGSEDIQIAVADAEALKQAQPEAQLAVIDGMNHVLKRVPAGDRAANMAAYSDPSLPVEPALADVVAAFVKR